MSIYSSTSAKGCILCCNYFTLDPCVKDYFTNLAQQKEEISQENLIYCYVKHVTPEIVASINMMRSSSQDFCQECRNINKKLVNLNTQLEVILKEISETVKQITAKANEERSFHQLNNHLTISQPLPSVSVSASSSTLQSLDEDRNYCGENNSNHGDAGVSEDLEDDDYKESIMESQPLKGPKKKSVNFKTVSKQASSEINNPVEEETDVQPNTVRSSDLLPHLDNPLGFECSSCHKKFSRLAILQRHDCEKPTHECSTCGKSFSTAFVLKLHSRCHSGEQPYKCETCGKCFSIKYNLMRHIRIHTGDKPFTCETCNKSFADETGYVRHCKTHKGKDDADIVKYKCDICSKQLSDYGALKEHLFFIHKHNQKCEVCGRAFRSVKTLEKHKLTHKEKVFQCDLCERKLSTAQALHHHLLVHRGEKPIQCSVCDKSFRDNHQLKCHVESAHVSPTPDDNFICDKCGKVFNNKIRYKRHLKHHRNRLQDCEICKKQFTTKQNLNVHIKRTHSDERNFKCELCSKAFKIKRDLARHKEYHHPSSETSFSCEKCQKTSFKSKVAFTIHQKSCGLKPVKPKKESSTVKEQAKHSQAKKSNGRPTTTVRSTRTKKKRVNYREEDDSSNLSSSSSQSSDKQKQNAEIEIKEENYSEEDFFDATCNETYSHQDVTFKIETPDSDNY